MCSPKVEKHFHWNEQLINEESEILKKVLKILMYLVLVYVVAVVTYGIVLKVKESINEKEKIKKQSPFTDRISFKYPESNISSVEILEKIQKKVKREEKIDLKDGKYRINLYGH